MKILSIGSDRSLFSKNSKAVQRVALYGSLVKELHIIVFSNISLKLKTEKIADNVWIYPTNSKNRWCYILDAIKIGKKIGGVDLVTAQDPFESGIVGWRLAFIKKARLQIQIHTDFLSPYFVKDSILNKIRVRISRFILPKADNIRVVSDRIKNSLIKSEIVKNWNNIIVLPIFTDIEYIKSYNPNINLHEKYPQFDFVILMASRLSEEKNISLALQAFKKVKEKYPKTGLVIVGSGPEREKLMQQATQHNLQSNVVFEPWSDDLISYYKTADLFLNTSNYEGYGLTLIESASSKCPIVTTNVGVVGEIINENNALICNVGDIECMVQKIVLAIENRAIRELLVKDALKAVSRVAISKEDYLKEHKISWEKYNDK